MIVPKIMTRWPKAVMPNALGIRMIAAQPGLCELRVTVAESHLNAHGTCHGGLLFTLADTAFGMAANAGDEAAVTQEAGIHYIAPAKLGEELTARATQVSRSGRTAILDVVITGEGGRQIALFRGQARFVG